MAKDYKEGLKGLRDEAEAAAVKIDHYLTRYGKSGHKDASKHQLMYSCDVLRSICQTDGEHYDVYCDILERILSPCIAPAASPAHWTTFLELLRYYHYALGEKKLYAECFRILSFLVQQARKLQSENDYKVILATYGYHLMLQAGRDHINAAPVNEEICKVLDAMQELFSAMLNGLKESNFTYAELISDFVCHLLQKRTRRIFLFYSKLPAKKSEMFGSFFNLLASIKIPKLLSEELSEQCQRNLDALAVFLQFDVVDQRQQQLALQHLRVCRDMRHFQSNQAKGFTFSVLYCYVKFIYIQGNTNDSTQTYADICCKWSKFFQKALAESVRDQWLLDVTVMFYFIWVDLHQRPTNDFELFWRRINSASCYAAHFELMLSCMQIVQQNTRTKLASWPCCNSVAKHIIVSLLQAAISAYCFYVANTQMGTEEAAESTVDKLNSAFLLIMRDFLSVINDMPCIEVASPIVKMLNALLLQLMRTVRTERQVQLCMSLLKHFTHIQNKIGFDEWMLLLRRIAKATVTIADQKLAAELHAYSAVFIVTQYPKRCDFNVLRHQIMAFHSNDKLSIESCLTQIYEQSCSQIKPILTAQQRRTFFWNELQLICQYRRDCSKLFDSLLKFTQTSYEVILVIRAAKLQTTANAKVRAICESILEKLMSKKGTAHLSPLEQLVLGHCKTMLHNIETEQRTFKIETCTEDNLEEILQSEQFAPLTYTTESRMIKQAVEALHGFEEFYDKAGISPITSDEAVIDWVLVIDDITSLALYFQYCSYREYATRAWLLHYRISNNIDDVYNTFRSLAYFLENSDYFDKDKRINIASEISEKLPLLLTLSANLHGQLKRNQSFVLLCLCQLAYYHAHCHNFSHAIKLLKFVQMKRNDLPERRSINDIVQSAIRHVKFRVIWKHLNIEQYQRGVILFTDSCLIREIETLLEEHRTITYVSTIDQMAFINMLFTFIEQIAECAANRLYDNVLATFFVCAFKLAMQTHAVTRVVQILISWVWINLQMEHVEKAHRKLKMIEYILEKRTYSELTQKSKKKESKEKKPVPDELAIIMSTDMEIVRRVANTNLSPLNGLQRKEQLSPGIRKFSLQVYFSPDNDNALQCNEFLHWIFFTVGCLRARLYFLLQDYEQLKQFYENGFRWIKQRENDAMSRCYQNIQLLFMQHYVNYLRAIKCHDKALLCIDSALKQCGPAHCHLDPVYYVNFLMQRRATCLTIKLNETNAVVKIDSARRVLNFDYSPEAIYRKKRNKRAVQRPATGITKKISEIGNNKEGAAFTIYQGSERQTPQHKKYSNLSTLQTKGRLKIARSTSSGSSGSSSCSSSIDGANGLDLNACQVINISELEESMQDNIENANPDVIVANETTSAKPKDKQCTSSKASTSTISSNLKENAEKHGKSGKISEKRSPLLVKKFLSVDLDLVSTSTLSDFSMKANRMDLQIAAAEVQEEQKLRIDAVESKKATKRSKVTTSRVTARVLRAAEKKTTTATGNGEETTIRPCRQENSPKLIPIGIGQDIETATDSAVDITATRRRGRSRREVAKGDAMTVAATSLSTPVPTNVSLHRRRQKI